MKKLETTIAATLLLASSATSAHGDGRAAEAWQHFLTSPDHIALLVSAAVAALGGLLYLRQIDKLQAIKFKKD